MLSVRFPRFSVAVLVLGIVGCTVAREPDVFSSRDSLGITIVESSSPEWLEGEGWVVEPDPLVTIGERDGPTEYLFSKIRSVSQLPDGRILVADEQAKNLRFFDLSGELLSTVGRDGEGPGEFRTVWTADTYRADSIFAYDYWMRRVSVFGSDGEFGRSLLNPTSPSDNMWVRGSLRDGRFILVSSGRMMFTGPPGIRLDSGQVVALSAEGEGADTLGTFVVGRRLVDERGMGSNVQMAPHGVLAVHRDFLYWGEGDRYEILEHSAEGAAVRVIRRRHDPVPVTEAMRAQYTESYVAWVTRESGEAGEERIRRTLEDAQFADHLPAYTEIIVDDTGHLWVGRFHFLGVPATEWDVFSPQGRWLGTVETPEGVEVLHIGRDLVLGVFSDEMGVQYVRGQQLNRRSRGIP